MKPFSFLCSLLLCAACVTTVSAKEFAVQSPNKTITLKVNIDKTISWAVDCNKQTVITPSVISLTLQGEAPLGVNPSVKTSKINTVNSIISASVYKKKNITDNYNELTITFKDNYSLLFRAYNDGVAYRWVLNRPGEVVVSNEDARFNFDANYAAYIPYANSGANNVYQCSFENTYKHFNISQMEDKPTYTPILIELKNKMKCAIVEADLEDYPGMFLRLNKSTKQGFVSDFAPFPLEEKQGGYNNIQSLVTKGGDFIAKTKGNCALPWRALIIPKEDKDLLNNDMVYKLATPSRVQDAEWIKPGQLAWDWWNNWNLEGVDFKAGINTETYKYYVDFAAKYNLSYVLLDEGWAAKGQLINTIPEIDLPAIIDYAKSKNVGIILWCGWVPLNQNMEQVFEHYAKMGVKGFKIDFMDRDDQKVVNFYYKVAQLGAQHHMLIDFHGAYKPTGLQRTYPNVINFEGVYGMEQLKWNNPDMPQNDVLISYIRMLAGPLDYTPGAMRNASKDSFRPIVGQPMSQGTRCHQIGLYVVFEAPLCMLADSPSNYEKEPECTKFISQIPTTFDQTIALDGEVGNYSVIARKKGNNWYVGAINNWDKRDITIDFSFLGPGKWKAEVFKDGINANNNGNDYKREFLNISDQSHLAVHLAEGGGWAAIVRAE
jgi:alpha-glucosidase